MDPIVSQVPPVTVIDNITYCWNTDLGSYTWCPTESQLYSVPTGILLLLSSFYGMISIAAVIGNTLVIFVVATSKSMQNVTNLFIANLAFSDVIIAVFCIPFQFYAALLQRWDLPEFMCKFCPFMQILSVNVSIFTLVAISLDRYRAIITPLHEKMSKTSAKIIISFIWTSSILVALPTGFLFKFSYVYDDINGGLKPFCSTEDNFDFEYPNIPELAGGNVSFIPTANFTSGISSGNISDGIKLIRGDHKIRLKGNYSTDEYEPSRRLGLFEIYGILLMVIEYALPLVIISIAYAHMGIRLWLTRTPGTAHDKRDECILSNKKKVIKMLFVVVLIFCLCWLPWHLYHCLVLISPDINQYRYINIIFFASHWLAMSNSCYNPFVYAIYSEKFKREFKECTHCTCCNYITLPGNNPSVPQSPWNQSGCHRRGANECLESGKLLTRDDTTIPNNRDCIEVATVEDDQITRGQSERQIQPEMCRAT